MRRLGWLASNTFGFSIFPLGLPQVSRLHLWDAVPIVDARLRFVDFDKNNYSIREAQNHWVPGMEVAMDAKPV